MRKKALIVLMLVPLYALLCALKTHNFWTATGFEKGERTFFWTESAMHLYLAEKVIHGESLSGIDYKAQTPEGLNITAHIDPGLPWLIGTTYQWLGIQQPPDLFAASFFVFYSSVTLFAVFLFSQAIFESTAAGLVSASLYAVATPAFVRSIGGLIKEDLALPCLTLGFYFFFSAIRKRSYLRAVISSLFIAAALLSWHFSQFMMLCFASALTLTVIGTPRWNRDERKIYSTWVLMMMIVSIALPLMRSKLFIVSPAMSLLYAILVFSWLSSFKKWKRWLAVASVFAISLGLYLKFGLSEQSHVFDLVIDKIRFLLQKPADPAELSYETRSNWIEDFHSPDWHFLFYIAGLYLPLGAFAVIRLGWRSFQRDPIGLFIAIFSLGFLFLFAIAKRMLTIEIIFLCIAMGGWITFKNRRMRAAGLALVFLTLAFEGWKSYHFSESNVYAQWVNRTFPPDEEFQYITLGDHQDILNWIRANTDPHDPILANMGLSSVILAYADRPIIVHSLFDSELMRDKDQKAIMSLFEDEDTFYRFATQNRAQYFIYDSRSVLRHDQDSDRYLTNNLKLKKSSAAYQFHFAPETLRHFELVYQNAGYRVYRIEKSAKPVVLAPSPVYQLSVFNQNPQSVYFEDRDLKTTLSQVSQSYQLTAQGLQLAEAGNVSRAISLWEKAMELNPALSQARAHLCLGYMILKNTELAKKNCTEALKYAPHSPLVLDNGAIFAQQTGDSSLALKYLNKALQIDPRDKKAQKLLVEFGNR